MRMRNRLRVVSFVLVVLLVSLLPVYGKVYIDIDSPTIQKFPIAVADFKNLGQTPDGENLSTWFADRLGNALQLTGFFNVIQRKTFLRIRGNQVSLRKPSSFPIGRSSERNLWLKGDFS